MKRIFKASGFIIFLVISYLVILYQFPKEAGRFPFLVVLFLSDFYLWMSFKNWFKRQSIAIKSLISVLYWLPLILLIITVGSRMAKFEMIADERLGILLQGFIFSAYAAKLLPVIFLIFADLIKGSKFLIKKIHSRHQKNSADRNGEKITRSRFIQQMGLVSGGILFTGLIAGMIKWVHDFKIHRHRLQLPNLPKSFDGLKIVQISDLHLGSWSSKKELEVAFQRINDLKPDMIFFTGDLVDYKTEEAFRFEKILSTLSANYGVFAILGNHDYGDYSRWPSAEAKAKNMTDLFALYRRIGWKLLKNNHAIIENEGSKIAIIGVENWGAIARFPQYGNIEQAKMNTDEASVKLLLSHDPSHWEKIISTDHPDIDLTFSGHTHGFQFGVEIKNFKWSPAQYAYKYWAGLYENDDSGQYLYVNRGLGTVGYPGRVGILPEITLFELFS